MYRKNKIASVLLMGLFLVTFIVSLSFCAKNNGSDPKFFVTRKTVDLGEYYEGQDIEYTFKVRNNGAGELKIVNVRPG